MFIKSLTQQLVDGTACVTPESKPVDCNISANIEIQDQDRLGSGKTIAVPRSISEPLSTVVHQQNWEPASACLGNLTSDAYPSEGRYLRPVPQTQILDLGIEVECMLS
jgi:hypothetical protein